ncbi:hypothetical protein JAAARDRAFT_646614 [Jaapia argillacea MUCL 33604]|uniref:Nephrocystin 3-like N-terminal domain-containing protein n=1 Tax=Jaapia argillacea MUCL 33604 TaxID=933084 RepID=A0A067Q8F8_9AGAM|nr:hypothetical protein JAAARDRAFT_646614 [Jaapia argillacea MUCL 33604]
MALRTIQKVTVIGQTVAKLPVQLWDVHAAAKEGNVEHNESALLEKLGSLVVHDAEWRKELVCSGLTRKAILDDIETWAVSSATDEVTIAYFPGVAGLGKTTVSHSVAHRLYRDGRDLLGASFFFSRDVGSRNSPKNVVATIAYHLAHFHHAYRSELCYALRRPVPSSCERQFQELFLDPLKKSKKPPSPLLIVMDALDECAEGIFVLKLLLAAIQDVIGHIKIFFTSRPQDDIDNILEGHKFHRVRVLLDDDSNAEDIRAYFDTRLADLSLADGTPFPLLDRDTREALYRSAAGLFIWASTACNFLSGSFNLDADLRLLLHPSATGKDNPEECLSTLYDTVLRRSYESYNRAVLRENFLPVIRVILVLDKPLSLAGLAEVLGVEEVVVCTIVRSLHAVLHSPLNPAMKTGDDETVRVIHPSFYRYLTDPCNESPFRVNIQQTNLWLAYRYLVCIQQCVDRLIALTANTSTGGESDVESSKISPVIDTPDSNLDLTKAHLCTYREQLAAKLLKYLDLVDVHHSIAGLSIEEARRLFGTIRKVYLPLLLMNYR